MHLILCSFIVGAMGNKKARICSLILFKTKKQQVTNKLQLDHDENERKKSGFQFELKIKVFHPQFMKVTHLFFALK